MAKEQSRMENDLERIKKRLLAGKQTLHETELKAEDLDATIQTAIRDQQKQAQNRKRLS
jgi:hypothetical protein